MPTSERQNDLLASLRVLLRESLKLTAEGALQPKPARAQGYVDGFMRALVEAGLCDHHTLLGVVREVRSEIGGPPTAAVEADTETIAA